MKADIRGSLRVDRATVRAWLDKLDQAARPATAMSLRRSERVAYRPDGLTLELAEGDGVGRRYAVAGRNLSAKGAGLLAGRFIYPGTRCKLTLVTLPGHARVIAGRVAHCRYLAGSGSLYEVGVAFDPRLTGTVGAS